VLRNVTKEETVQYILALLLQMLQANPNRAALFHQVKELHGAGAADAYTIFCVSYSAGGLVHPGWCPAP